jgi:hypothetical protein
LAQLEQGLVDSAIQCRPAYAIYQALPGHVSRAAGLEAWDQFGPKFVVGKDGSVMWKGRFDDEKQPGLLAKLRRLHQTLPSEAKQYLEKSALYRGLLYMHRPINDQDIDLFLRIVDRSRRIVESRYQGAQFHVVFWDFSGEDPTETKLIEGLKGKGLTVHLISTILPDYREHENRFEIHPADGHPNKLAYELLADYILRAIVKDSDNGAQSPMPASEVEYSLTRRQQNQTSFALGLTRFSPGNPSERGKLPASAHRNNSRSVRWDSAAQTPAPPPTCRLGSPGELSPWIVQETMRDAKSPPPAQQSSAETA